VALSSPVIRAFVARRPDTRLTIRTAAPEALLREHVPHPFRHLPRALDLGMAMHHALEIDVSASLEHYRGLHRRWAAAVEEAARELRTLRPDLVVANIPYLSLAAAAHAGIPAVALCCLNWADIFGHYCGDDRDGRAIVAQIREAYGAARAFLAPEPAMPMPWLANRRTVGPIARVGQDRREELRRRLEVGPDTRLVLLSLGGVPFDVDVSRWPPLHGVHVVCGSRVVGHHPRVTRLESVDMPHIDVVASADLVLGKPGYGTVAEVAVHGVPMLYVSRGGWPEEPALVAWLSRHGRCREIPRDALLDGSWAEAVEPVLRMPAPPRPAPTGAEEAADAILRTLGA
jgi:UDP:flavonoid glycosyltransferase YjiC (YdhE family)